MRRSASLVASSARFRSVTSRKMTTRPVISPFGSRIGGDALVDRPGRPVPGDQERVPGGAEGGALPQHLGGGTLDFGPRLLIDPSEDLRQRSPRRIRRGPTEEAFGGRVDHGDASRGVGDDHAVPDALERDPEPLALVTPLGLRPAPLHHLPLQPRPTGPAVPGVEDDGPGPRR